MRQLKYLYYIAVIFNALQVAFFLFAPFGGIALIRDTVRDGIYRAALFECLNGSNTYQVLQLINSIIAIIYFASLCFCVATLAFRQMEVERKYKYGIYSCLITIIILVVGVLLNQFAC